GLRTILRIYAGLYAALHRSTTLRGKVEMALNAQLPKEPPRVQQWYQAFIEGLKKGAPKPGETQFQVTLPRDNPILGLVEIATGIARRFPTILEIQNVHHCQSLAIHSMLEALITESTDARLLLILASEPVNDAAKAWMAEPLLDLLDRRAELLHALPMAPWGADETTAYLASKGLSGDAGRIAEIASGRPGFIAELVDWLSDNDKLSGDLSGLTLADIADSTPDADELEDGEGDGEGESRRKHAGAEDAEQIAFISALLGLSFPSGLVADMLGLERDSVDDLLDATDGLYKEVQFSQPMNTWIYQFIKALHRESVLSRHTSDEDQEIARRVALFLERFLVPRGYEFLAKTMRMFAEHGAGGRAAVLRAQALGSDRHEVWTMSYDLMRYFDEIPWPAPAMRRVYMSLLDRMVQGGDVNQTENLFNTAMQWATTQEDRSFQAWL
ncbi:MAG: hypothetical protein KC457_32475, partial [Myxococcales bacterium]|nr:hypothetical protein [Myxococcales bacterium]